MPTSVQGFELGRIYKTSMVSGASRLGAPVTIGVNIVVYDNVELGDEAIVGPNVVLGEPNAGYYRDPAYKNPPLKIGVGALIRSGSIIYAGSRLGDHFECGHHVTIREGASIGPHCRVGTLSDIQGDCEINQYTRLHSNVHVAKGSSIGKYVWLFPYVVLTNDRYPPSEQRWGVAIEDYAVVATGAVLLPGVRVGKGALVGAHALVRHDVPAATVVTGTPATRTGDLRLLRDPDTGDALYPWPPRFSRGMPWDEAGYEAWTFATQSEHREDL